MADLDGPEFEVDASVIDGLLAHLPAVAPAAEDPDPPPPVPQSPDLQAIARELGIEVKRGVADPDFDGIVIPVFYSEREARLTIARGVARAAVEHVGGQCRVEEGGHECPSREICEFVESAKSDDKVLDMIAAAVLMPTRDFLRWRDLLEGEVGPLSDSYGVPRELARIRLRTVDRSIAPAAH